MEDYPWKFIQVSIPLNTLNIAQNCSICRHDMNNNMDSNN